MTDNVIMYLIVWVVSILAVLSFVIGIEKMIKIILGNYVLSGICLAATQSLDILVKFLQQPPDTKFFGLSFSNFADFIANGQTTIILVLYIALLLLIYHKSKIRISIPEDEIIKKALYLILVPLTVLSVILTLQIAIMWINVINISALQALAEWITKNPSLYMFITLTPVWILIHGLATILITSEIKITIKTDVI